MFKMAHKGEKLAYSRKRPRPYNSPTFDHELLRKAQVQDNFRRNLIFLQPLGATTSAYTILQNAVTYIGSTLRITNNRTRILKDSQYLYKFTLSIDNETIAEDHFSSESLARVGLAELAVPKLQKTCFTIIRKIHPISSPKVNFAATSTQAVRTETSDKAARIPETSLTGGIGEKMLKRMGWGGGGLGAQEQGRLDIVENYTQVARQGIGSKDITQEVTRILQKHSASNTINSVAFSNDFSKEERSVIHEIARKLNLKSRSYGKGSDRTLVIQSKMRLIDLVRSLLEVNGENEQYQLLVPTDFKMSNHSLYSPISQLHS